MRILFRKRHKESGFTAIEAIISGLIVGILATGIGVGITTMKKDVSLQSAATEVEMVINRCQDIAKQEGVDVYLQFFTADQRCDHTYYAIYRCAPEGFVEGPPSLFGVDKPSEPPTPGNTYFTDEDGHYWFEFLGAEIKAPLCILFERSGVLVKSTQLRPSTQNNPEITLTANGETKTVLIAGEEQVILADGT